MPKNNRSATTAILSAILVSIPLFLFLSLSSCGSNPLSSNVPPPAIFLQDDDPSDQSSQSPTFNPIVIPIPGFTPQEKVIFPSRKISDVEFPIPASFPYLIAWVATFDEDDKPVKSPSEVPEDGSRKVVAISSSGEDATIPACLFELPGEYTLSAITFSPFSEELDELGYEDIVITIDGYCLDLEFEEFDLPYATDGDPENLTIRMRIIDGSGNTLLDPEGNRPPVSLTLQAVDGTLRDYSGITDDQGYFHTTATINSDQAPMVITAIAEYQPDDPGLDPLIREGGPWSMYQPVPEFLCPPPPGASSDWHDYCACEAAQENNPSALIQGWYCLDDLEKGPDCPGYCLCESEDETYWGEWGSGQCNGYCREVIDLFGRTSISYCTMPDGLTDPDCYPC